MPLKYKLLPIVGCLYWATSTSYAMPQFNVGIDDTEASTLVPLDLSDQCPEVDTVISLDVGASGIKKYSSINIPANCILTFTPSGNGSVNNSKPVRLIVFADVLIDGKIDISGEDTTVYPPTIFPAYGGAGGPGGYDGGTHFYDINYADGSERDIAGYGPKGSYFADTYDERRPLFGPIADNIMEQRLIGGSGGLSYRQNNGDIYFGAGGGGAILIAANGTITLNGSIDAGGGVNINDYNSNRDAAGGMIHLLANEVAGTGSLDGESFGLIETLNNVSVQTPLRNHPSNNLI